MPHSRQKDKIKNIYLEYIYLDIKWSKTYAFNKKYTQNKFKKM